MTTRSTILSQQGAATLFHLKPKPSGFSRTLCLLALMLMATPTITLCSKMKKPPVWVASWYGKEMGKITANGEPYNPKFLTVAHRTLPFGTILRLTNIRNGRSILATVNDRGPWIQGRELDVSEGSAIALGFKRQGIAYLQAEVLQYGNSKYRYRAPQVVKRVVHVQPIGGTAERLEELLWTLIGVDWQAEQQFIDVFL